MVDSQSSSSTSWLPPWLESAWSGLYTRHISGKLPHALLLEGPTGLGKVAFCGFVAEAFLCSDASEKGACGNCASCTLLKAGNHPDINWVGPLDDSKVIKIDQVRALIDWLQLTPQYDSYKIAILNPADLLTRQAANSLLKTLEEPGSADRIFLLTDKRGALPATVLSRCQRINLALKEQDTAINWLAEQGVADPAIALSLAGDAPLLGASVMKGELGQAREQLFAAWYGVMLGKASIAKSVDAVADLSVRHCLSLMIEWVVDIVHLQVSEHATIRHQDLRGRLSAVCHCLSCAQWFTLYDQLLHLHRTDSASFKTQAVLEGIFADIRLYQTT